MNLSIIIPLYNEEALVLKTLEKLMGITFPSFVSAVQILVVDDASTDSSFKAVESWVNDKSNVSIIKHNKNMGKGAAVKTGVSNSLGDYILIQDADLELNPEDIPSLLIAANTLQVPFVNGSRYLPGVIRTQAGFKRYFANKIFTLLTSVLVDVHLTDVACGYKLIKRDFYNQLNLVENRFGFEAELIIKCARIRKNWIAEVPVNYSPRNAGEGKKLNNFDGLKILKTILKYGLFRLR